MEATISRDQNEMNSKNTVVPVNEEIYFGDAEIIVSKTDLKGRITYANDVFCRVAEMCTRQVIGAPHSIIRHPHMPRAIFHELWRAVQEGREIFAYVKNMSRTGKYYWVIAHVTPSYDKNGKICGYHSNRRKPNEAKVKLIDSLYKELRQLEEASVNKKDGLQNSLDYLHNHIAKSGLSYDEFIWGL